MSSSLEIQDVQPVHDGPYICAIFTKTTTPPTLAYDRINLLVYVEPELKVDIEDWIAENGSASLTCSAPRVKPSVSSMAIKVDNNRVERQKNEINVTEREDKTFANSFSVSMPVTRSDNGKRVSCEALWSGPTETKTISSNTETLRVVWPVDIPQDVTVKSGIKSCHVSWRPDPNALQVYINYICLYLKTSSCAYI